MKTVLVRHISDGNGKLKLANKVIVQNIVATYSDGRIKTSSGDTWMVVPCGLGKADFMTAEITG